MMLVSRKNTEFLLIPLAVTCQFFACAGMYFMKSYAGSYVSPIPLLPSPPPLLDTFFLYWFTFSFIGRVFGAYFFGKYADRTSFFSVMRLVTICHILLSFLVVIFCIAGKNSYHTYYGFYLARFLYSSLMPVTLILPAIYLLKKYPNSQHILISSIIILATFLGKFFAYIFTHHVPAPHMQIWYWLPVFSSFLALYIYNHVEKNTSSAAYEAEVIKHSALSIHKKLMAFTIGVACNAGITYYYSFLNPYLVDIVIVKNYDFITSQLPFYIAFGLFVLPAAKICQKIGILKTLSMSLISILILGMGIPFITTSNAVYAPFQILFACFLANLLAPSLAILHQLFKDTKNTFDTIFWFALGSSLSMLCLNISSVVGFSLHFPLAGLLVFATCILICLIAILSNSFSKTLTRLEDTMSLKSIHQSKE